MLLSQHLRSAEYGSYATNQAFITISDWVQLFRSDGHFQDDANYNHLAVFVHEYLHYLHNFSTVSGFVDFLTWVRLARLFTHTVGLDGKSRGSDVLSEAQRRELRQLRLWQRSLNGDIRPAEPMFAGVADNRLRMVAVEQRALNIDLPGDPLNVPDVELKIGLVDGPEETVVRFGMIALLEGLALEVDRVVAGGPAGVPGPLDDVPAFPYRLARKVLRHMSGQEFPTEIFIRVSLLALCSAAPAQRFLEIATQLAGASEVTIKDIVAKIEEADRSKRNGAIDAVLTHDLPTVIGCFAGRGKISVGAELFNRNFRFYLVKRQSEPFFDLDAFLPTINPDQLSKLLQTSPPCPLLQKEVANADDERTPVFWFGEFEAGLDANQAEEGLGTLQGFLTFMATHVRGDIFEPTDRLPLRGCRYFACCGAPFRDEHPDLCMTRPWSSFDPQTNAHCWYGSGVAAARGRTDL